MVEQTETELQHQQFCAALLTAEISNCLFHRFSILFLSQIRVKQNKGIVYFVDLYKGNTSEMDEKEVRLKCDLRLFVFGF